MSIGGDNTIHIHSDLIYIVVYKLFMWRLGVYIGKK